MTTASFQGINACIDVPKSELASDLFQLMNEIFFTTQIAYVKPLIATWKASIDQLTETTHFPKSRIGANIWPWNLLNRCSGVWKWSKILFSSHLSFSFNWFHILLILITFLSFFDNHQHLSQPKIIDCIFQSIICPATIMGISRKKWWGTIKQNTSCP